MEGYKSGKTKSKNGLISKEQLAAIEKNTLNSSSFKDKKHKIN